MLAIPTVRVLRSVSGADEEVVEEPGALLGWDRLEKVRKVTRQSGTYIGELKCKERACLVWQIMHLEWH